LETNLQFDERMSSPIINYHFGTAGATMQETSDPQMTAQMP